MPSISTLAFALAAVNAVTAAPLNVLTARNTCGVAPTATGSQTILSQPTNAKTAQQCLADCDGNSLCQSFIFGMVDNAIKCELFSVAASKVPAQSSTNLVAYDKACASIPTVTPTASNPKGLITGSQKTEEKTEEKNEDTTEQKSEEKAAAKLKATPTPTPKASTGKTSNNNGNQKQGPVSSKTVPKATPTPSPKASTSKTNTNENQTQQAKRAGAQPAAAKVGGAKAAASPVAAAKVCAGKPTGTGNAAPLATASNVNTLAACVARCKAESTCKSAEFGKVQANGPNVCRLFAVAAAQVPAPTNGQSVQISDVSC